MFVSDLTSIKGLINSYRAWKAQYETSYENGNEYLLPGLNYTRYDRFSANDYP
jgi:hypothetical protein